MLPEFFSALSKTIPWTYELSTLLPLDESFRNRLTLNELPLLQEVGSNPDYVATNFVQRSIPRR